MSVYCLDLTGHALALSGNVRMHEIVLCDIIRYCTDTTVHKNNQRYSEGDCMAYLTATQAASRLGRSEKTIRRWITEGRVAAFHPHGRKNQLAIAESDIDRLAQELAQFEQPAAEQGSGSLVELIARINQLEQRVTELEQQLAEQGRLIHAINDAISHVGTPVHAAVAGITRRATASTSPTETPVDVPSGSILAVDFARDHDVPPATFRDHVVKGLTPSLSIPNPARPGQFTRWLSLEQQQQAIDFWTSNRTPYSPNPEKYPAITYPDVQSESEQE